MPAAKPYRSIWSRPSWVAEYVARGDMATALRFAAILPPHLGPLDRQHLERARQAAQGRTGAAAEIARLIDEALSRPDA